MSPLDLIPWTSSEAEKKRSKPVPGVKPSGRTLLDQFAVAKKEKGMEVVMNEDGTMYTAD